MLLACALQGEDESIYLRLHGVQSSEDAVAQPLSGAALGRTTSAKRQTPSARATATATATSILTAGRPRTDTEEQAIPTLATGTAASSRHGDPMHGQISRASSGQTRSPGDVSARPFRRPPRRCQQQHVACQVSPGLRGHQGRPLRCHTNPSASSFHLPTTGRLLM